MIILKETINSVSTERIFKNLKEACEVINLQVEHAESLIGHENGDFTITSVSKNKPHTIEIEDKVQTAVSWTVYFRNGSDIKCFATITKEK